ncbi:HAMP domain-containing sensor histidine kinase [Nannocystis sp.]|uniref:sensor histidine kinase n=1 Tax=Nannocystis sp. TaxID=1962667 RepID=UPI0025FA1A39|nr:HAMP domain-containing sensor histidine kinase [Nannocystis sp.]MBK7830646.1 HAMP domain-containing histidine kinase [Nannocystis sp.]
MSRDTPALLERMIPPKLRANREDRLRAQMLLLGSLGICGFVLVIGVVVIWAGILDTNLAVVVLTAAALGLLPYLQYRLSSYRLPAALIVILLVVTMPLYCWLLGAFPVPALVGFPIVPLLAAFFLGRVVGLVSAVALALAALAAGLLLPLPGPALLGSLASVFIVMAVTMTLTSAQLAWVFEGARRRAEEDLVALNRALDAAREAAEVARAAADAANRSKTEFLRHVSHELRTPLNSVLGYSELVHEELSERGQTEIAGEVAQISRASQQLLALLKDLLDVSRIEAEAIQLEVVEVELAVLLAQVRETVRPLVAANHNTLDVVVAPGLPRVATDERRLMQVLLNLVSNACKFTDHGRIFVAAELGDDGVLLQVRDTGIGMSETQRSRIFEPFVQVHPSAERRHQGTGLGLSLSRQIVRSLGGTIDVASVPGGGTTFTVRLPLRGPGSAGV